MWDMDRINRQLEITAQQQPGGITALVVVNKITKQQHWVSRLYAMRWVFRRARQIRSDNRLYEHRLANPKDWVDLPSPD